MHLDDEDNKLFSDLIAVSLNSISRKNIDENLNQKKDVPIQEENKHNFEKEEIQIERHNLKEENKTNLEYK